MVNLNDLPDREYYRPLFSPWAGFGEFPEFYRIAAPHTLVSPDRCYVLYTLARQAIYLNGDFWECGVYKGGTAAMLGQLVARTAHAAPRRLHLFDTFGGMPEANPEKDWHQHGDFADTSLEAVKAVVGHPQLVEYHQGLIPNSFAGLEYSKIALAHIDVDIYQSVMDCCRFIFPRIVRGGFMIVDDYGFPTCPGARAAVDQYFAQSLTFPLVLPTGQAIIFKNV